MNDELRPSGIFRDLTTNPTIKMALLTDCELAVDDFAGKYGQIIRNHYATGGYNMDFEDGYQTAARLWRYLRDV